MSGTKSRSRAVIIGLIICATVVIVAALSLYIRGKREGNILTYTASAAVAENHLTLSRRGDDLLLTDDKSGAVLAVQPVARTRKVSVKGADGPTNDTLTVDFSGGMFSPPEGIHYDGGVGGFDTLAIAGGAALQEHYDVKNPSDGVITIDQTKIDYANIEPINDTVPAATFVINATAAAETINIVNGPIVAGFQTTQVNSATSTFELVNFANKTDVTVNGLGGDDQFALNVTTPAVGLSTLRLNGGGGSFDQATVTNFTLPGGTLSFLGFSSVGQTGPIQTANLAAQAGLVSLGNAGNAVSNIAGTTSEFVQFGFNFKNNGNLNVGTVDGVVGIRGINNNTAPFGDVSLSGTAGAVLTVTQPVTTPNGRIFFNFDDMNINNSVTAPALGFFATLEGQVNLEPVTLSRTTDLGTNSGGNLGLTDTDLDHVTTAVLQLGGSSPQYTGPVIVTAPVTAAGYTTMEINTTGAVSSSGSGSIAVTNLLILSGVGIGPLPTAVSNLDFKNTAGVVDITNTGNLTIANVAAAGEASNSGLTTLSTSGSMIFGNNIVSTALIVSSGAGNFVGAGGTLHNLNQLIFTDASVNGHTWTIGPTSLVENGNAAISFSNVAGLEVVGSSGNDTFNVTPSPTTNISIRGGEPTTAPGDTLNVNTFGTTSPTLHITSSTGASKDGNYTFGNRQTVSFTNIETITATGPLTAQGTTVGATEGLPFTNTAVATFQSFDPALTASNFTATINWGDSTAFSTGTITNNGGGAFTVKGGHTYAEEGSYNISVTIHDALNNFDAIANSAATVADAALSVGPSNAGSSTTFSGVGGNNTSVTAGTANAAMTAYQAAIGGVNNGGTASPQNGGFRTINWDGVALTATDGIFNNEVIVPNHVVGIPTNRFQTRGVSFEEIYAVSDDGFVSVNPGAAGQFPAFSPTKTFAMFNDNTIDFSFVLPSAANTPPIGAVSRGFGAIFLDVENPNTTSIEYFSGETSLGKFFVPTGPSGQPEFFGVLFQNPVVTNVEITLGNAKLFSFDGSTVTAGPADLPPTTDLAVTDDFVYPEPRAVGTGININAIAGTSFTAKVASFTDADPNGQASDYSVVIDWGDGTTSAGGVTPNAANPDDGTLPEQTASITPNLSGGFDVTGTHTYTTTGTFKIVVAIRDTGGASIAAVSTAVVTGVSQTGSMQFNAISSSVLESASTVSLTVTRTGDTTQPSSVNFETNDGTALQKSDYTFNSGTVQFAAGDTSKTITISLVNDDLVEGNQTFFVTLSNPSFNYVVGTPSSIAVTILDDDTVPPVTNPIDDPTFFVRQNYLDFLGREPDTTGLNFWVSQITSCGANPSCIDGMRVNVSAAFFLSIEYQETSGDVIRTQRVAFGGQSSDPSTRISYLQFMRDTRQVGAGVIVGQPGFDTLLEQNKQAYATQIVSSPAFLARFPILPAANYVDALAASAGVTLTAAERTAAINAFGAGGTLGRIAALRSVSDSNSVRQAEQLPSFVLAEYFGYLRRNPTDPPDNNDTGYQFWLAKLISFNGDFNKAEMVKAFIASTEYRQRFGP